MSAQCSSAMPCTSQHLQRGPLSSAHVLPICPPVAKCREITGFTTTQRCVHLWAVHHLIAVISVARQKEHCPLTTPPMCGQHLTTLGSASSGWSRDIAYCMPTAQCCKHFAHRRACGELVAAAGAACVHACSIRWLMTSARLPVSVAAPIRSAGTATVYVCSFRAHTWK